MVKIEWIITDDLSNISLNEFNNEWNGIISGYFELVINQVKVGFCPNRKICEEEEGMEDILYWLNHLLDGVNMIKKGVEYEIILLTMNLYKMNMKLGENMEIYFINKKTNEIKWNEEVELQEFENELYESTRKFLQVVKETNPELLKSKWMRRLISVDLY